MSIRVMSIVWDCYPGGGSELLALLALADWSDDNGKCFPSIAAIARKIRLSRAQTQRVVHRLVNDEFVAVVGNETGGAPGTTRKYWINLSLLTGRTDATGSANATGRTHAQEGSHGRGETGSANATQTVIEPSRTVSTREKARAHDTNKPDDGFEVFWKAYPLKKAKGAAMKAWSSLKPNAEIQDAILKSLAWQRSSIDWTKDGAKFIPHPATWLNGQRWLDEPPAGQPSAAPTMTREAYEVKRREVLRAAREDYGEQMRRETVPPAGGVQ